jgi:glycosyltransferase involved in cell wall biosynthesis
MSQVTIIITSYNKEPYVKEAIDSCLNQTFKDFELLIIDDGSTDNSTDIIDSYSDNPLVSIIKQENKGVIYTRNRAIQEAKGEFILQLDGDDRLGKLFLEKTVPILVNDSKVGIAFCKTELIGEGKGIWDRVEYTLERQLTANLIVITALFRKEDYDKTIGYNPVFNAGLEDWDFWLSIIELGKEVVEVNDVQFYYRIGFESRNHSIKNEKEIKRFIFENHSQLYLDLGLDPVNLLWEIRKGEDVNFSLQVYKNSFEYKLGKLLLLPLRLTQKLFR